MNISQSASVPFLPILVSEAQESLNRMRNKLSFIDDVLLSVHQHSWTFIDAKKSRERLALAIKKAENRINRRLSLLNAVESVMPAVGDWVTIKGLKGKDGINDVVGKLVKITDYGHAKYGYVDVLVGVEPFQRDFSDLEVFEPVEPHPDCLCFCVGSGDTWICNDVDGLGFHIELLSDGLTWYWEANKKHWSLIGSGQTDSRKSAINLAINCLLSNGLSLQSLPAVEGV